MRVIRGLSKLQKSPDNTFIPVHMHLRPRTRSTITVWHLPQEILLKIMKSLHIKDILSMKQVHRYFRDLIDSQMSIWMAASFQDTWPSPVNLNLFEKAADQGNIEALVKLALAYLYNEGLPGDFEGRKITRNGESAAEMFIKLENLLPNTTPFSWLFIRPPWSVSGACCKECVFTCMQKHLQKFADKKIDVCVAQIHQLLDDVDNESAATSHLQRATEQGSGVAGYMLWQQNKIKKAHDRADELESIRQLRNISSNGHLDAVLALCKLYSQGKYGGLSQSQAALFVREFVKSSKPSRTNDIFKTSTELTPSMRYILVDWLVEVAGMKDFSSQTLHIAISVIDRYLRVHQTSRTKLQLLGVAAMILCSRFLGRDIITIREAAWLTDNTYRYEDVVRMMGEIIATIKGNIRVATGLDYVEIFSTLANLDRKTSCLAEYICELCLLQAEMGQYSPAEIAASAVLLARLLTKADCPWPSKMQQFTGFSLEDICRSAFHIHEKCFLEGSVVDHRDVTLQAVKQRYSDESYYQVSSIEIMSYDELCSSLGVTEQFIQGADVNVKFKNADDLILSPRRNKARYQRQCDKKSDRDSTATPSIEKFHFMNESAMSGYEGDHEEDEDSFLEFDDLATSFKSDSFLEDLPGSESDTYFASLSSRLEASGSSHTFNKSFVTESCFYAHSNFNITVNASITCDNESSSGVSSSPSISSDSLFDRNRSDKTLVLSSSDSDNNDVFMEDASPSKALRRRTLKRKCKDERENTTKAFIIQ